MPRSLSMPGPSVSCKPAVLVLECQHMYSNSNLFMPYRREQRFVRKVASRARTCMARASRSGVSGTASKQHSGWSENGHAGLHMPLRAQATGVTCDEHFAMCARGGGD